MEVMNYLYYWEIIIIKEHPDPLMHMWTVLSSEQFNVEYETPSFVE